MFAEQSNIQVVKIALKFKREDLSKTGNCSLLAEEKALTSLLCSLKQFVFLGDSHPYLEIFQCPQYKKTHSIVLNGFKKQSNTK